MVTLEKVQCVGLLNHLIEIPGDRGGVKMFDPIIDLDILRELEEDIQPSREPVKKKVENSTLRGWLSGPHSTHRAAPAPYGCDTFNLYSLENGRRPHISQ